MANVNVSVHRREFGETFIIGDLFVNGRLIGKTLEYPWRGNTAWNSESKQGKQFPPSELRA